jgi:hypothetical protein
VKPTSRNSDGFGDSGGARDVKRPPADVDTTERRELASEMSDPRPAPTRQPLNSLATRLILFVFVSTFATALVVSWISIQSTHTYLSQQIGRPSRSTPRRDVSSGAARRSPPRTTR